ncbi:MAG: N-acetyl-alpha-D-glucosaminyl L-malate synthase BshA, partial [Sphingomonadales bacterium]
ITLVGRDKTYAPVVTFSIKESDAITAESQNLREETYKYFAITKEIEVIRNFVDVQRFSRKPIDAFRKAIAPNGEKLLLHASNFRKIKRVTDVVRIFANVKKELPAKLLFVGDGPERSTAEDLSRELGVCNDILFVGKQEQMEDILAIADIFLLTSEYESFGLAALEAMAAGVPVISTDAGGLAEINIHKQTGFLSPVGDVATMSSYALQLLKDEKLLSTFRKKAHQQALQFDINTVIPTYEKLYERFLANK